MMPNPPAPGLGQAARLFQRHCRERRDDCLRGGAGGMDGAGRVAGKGLRRAVSSGMRNILEVLAQAAAGPSISCA